MFINPKVAIEKGWIKGIKDLNKQVQPNAVDFTLDKVMTLNTDTVPRVGETFKAMRNLYEAPPTSNYWELEGQRVYDGTSDVYVEVPEGVAAVLFTRSTFARNGVFVVSGLYDSGYKGNVGFTIYTVGGPINIEVGTRIGQIAFLSADSAGMYAGGWNHKQGTHYTDQANKVPSPTQLEAPIGQKTVQGIAKELEQMHRWNSDQGGKPAGKKNFI